jgi:hypothetical protein
MRAPPMPKTLMAGPWEGTDGDPGVPTTYVGGIDGEPLGGTNRDLGAPTTYVGDFDGGPP